MKYNVFLNLFLAATLAGIVTVIFYVYGFFNIINTARQISNSDITNPFEPLASIFTPQLIVAFCVAAITGLAYRIYAIVSLAKNKTVSDGEKALWVVGFVMMGFVTGIVYLVLARSKNFVE
jgi:hypothetical protein